MQGQNSYHIVIVAFVFDRDLNPVPPDEGGPLLHQLEDGRVVEAADGVVEQRVAVVVADLQSVAAQVIDKLKGPEHLSLKVQNVEFDFDVSVFYCILSTDTSKSN